MSTRRVEKPKTRKLPKSAIDGRIISIKKLKANPDTAYLQTVPVRKKGPQK